MTTHRLAITAALGLTAALLATAGCTRDTALPLALTTCDLPSDCAEGERCSARGRCTIECRQDVDCTVWGSDDRLFCDDGFCDVWDPKSGTDRPQESPEPSDRPNPTVRPSAQPSADPTPVASVQPSPDPTPDPTMPPTGEAPTVRTASERDGKTSVMGGETLRLRAEVENPADLSFDVLWVVEPDVGRFEDPTALNATFHMVGVPLDFTEQDLLFSVTIRDRAGRASKQEFRVHAMGNVMVMMWDGTILVFDSGGVHIGDLISGDTLGTGEGMLLLPDKRWLVVDRGGDDPGRLLVYDRQGFGPQEVWDESDARGNPVLDDPYRAALLPNGLVAVTDTGLDRIVLFDPSSGDYEGVFWEAEGSEEPGDMLVHSNGQLYVADSFRGKVMRFDMEGNMLGNFGASSMWSANGLIELDDGSLLIPDDDKNHIWRYNANGTAFPEPWADTGSNAIPSDMAIMGDFLLIVSRNGSWVGHYELSDGTDLGHWNERSEVHGSGALRDVIYLSEGYFD